MTDQLDTPMRKTVPRGVAAVAAGVLLLSGLAGCGSSAGEAPADRTPKATGTAKDPQGPPRMILRGKGEPTAALLGLLPGTLVVTDRNCVAVKAETGGRIVALNWGYGWTVRVEGDKAVVYDARGKVFAREGDKVSLGGGASDRFTDHPCAGDGMFAVNNAPVDE
ncbi:hypothetical protein [Streptomyces sp. NPDC086023]|uniref:hypothetical protein n=1 Tax=Streptomyces sp. NPDC086023 TaxID=3365746 RepID=UPI0037D58C94